MLHLSLKAIILLVLWNWTIAQAAEIGDCPLVHTKSYLTVAERSQTNGQPQSTASVTSDANSYYHLSLLNFQHHQNPFEKVFLHMKINENNWKTIILTSVLPPTENYGGMYSDPFELVSGDVIHFYATYEIKGKQCDTEMLMATIPPNEDVQKPNDSTNTQQHRTDPKAKAAAPAAATQSTNPSASPSGQHKAMDEVANEESKLPGDERNIHQDPYAHAQQYYHPQMYQQDHNQVRANGIDPAQNYQYVDPAAYYGQYYYQPHNQDQANNQMYAYYQQMHAQQQSAYQHVQYQQHASHQTDKSQEQQNSKQPNSNAHTICNSLPLNYTHQPMEFAPAYTYILTFSSPTPLPIDTIDVHSRLNANEIQHERIAADVTASHIQRVQHVVTVNKGEILSYYWSFHSTDDEGTLTECQTEVMTIDNRIA